MKKLLLPVIFILTISIYSYSQTNKSLSFNGLYIARSGRVEEASADIYTYLRFYKDGSVYLQAVTANDPQKIASWFGRFKKYSQKGKYTISADGISLSLDNKNTEDYELEGLQETSYKGTITADDKLCLMRNAEKEKVCFLFSKVSDTTSFKYTADKTIKIPGDWKLTQVLKGSRQVFFKNEDSTTIAIAVHTASTFPSYKEIQTEFETAYAFYEWDSKFMKEEEKMEVKKIKEDKEKAYIVWSAKDAYNDNYHLFARNNDDLYNFMIYDEKMTLEKKVAFLEMMYDLNK
jgi:hypothetical protein